MAASASEINPMARASTHLRDVVKGRLPAAEVEFTVRARHAEFGWSLGLLMAALLCGCGATTYPIRGEFGTVPFEGELQVSEPETGQRRYVLDVQSVPEPWRLRPDAHHYVGWIVSDRRGAFKVATVNYDDLARRARLDERNNDEGRVFLVTAEEESWAREPSRTVLFEVVLWAREDDAR